jgi:purine catabolism regulator
MNYNTNKKIVTDYSSKKTVCDKGSPMTWNLKVLPTTYEPSEYVRPATFGAVNITPIDKQQSVTALPSLEYILNLPAFRSAELISGGSQIHKPVTWVHIAEIIDVWRFLSGGELLLSTGIELVRVSPAVRRNYLYGLAKSGARALGIELVHWITKVPDEIMDAANDLSFPIVVFRKEVSFGELTRAAHREILRPSHSCGTESAMQAIINSLVDTGRDRSVLKRVLGPLLTLSPRPQTTLLTTLEVLLNTQFNITATARELGLRRQTIYYRINQLTGLLGSLDDSSKALGFMVALNILRSGAAISVTNGNPVRQFKRNKLS